MQAKIVYGLESWSWGDDDKLGRNGWYITRYTISADNAIVDRVPVAKFVNMPEQGTSAVSEVLNFEEYSKKGHLVARRQAPMSELMKL